MPNKRHTKAGVKAALREYYARLDSIFGEWFSDSEPCREVTKRIAGPLREGRFVVIRHVRGEWSIEVEGN